LSRISDLQRLYDILYGVRERLGEHRLSGCHGRMNWPRRGVYFFFEAGEQRTGSGSGPRIVRVGTHAVTETSRRTLWNRLSQHRGVARTGAGNHRGSIFRLLVGEALLNRDKLDVPTWGQGSSRGEASRLCGLSEATIQEREHPIEVAVSEIVGAMPLVWVEVENVPGLTNRRGFIERNAIALLSSSKAVEMDPPTSLWLGLHSRRRRVTESGLWNQDYVGESYDPAFLDVLAHRAAVASQP
jgi:hypothetical protein